MKASDLITALKEDRFNDALQNVYGSQASGQIGRYCQAIEKFISLYGDKDVVIFSVPGRSEVLGNHTDHQHGEVLAAAINLDIIGVVHPTDDNIVKIVSDEYYLNPVDLSSLEIVEDEMGKSEALVRGVAADMIGRGGKAGGFEAFMTSDVLQGSGLSSSAAFEVLIGTIFNGLYNANSFTPVQLAQIGQFAENKYFGKPCGLMDQTACSVGSLVHIDFGTPDEPFVEKVEADFEKAGLNLCITDVHASHADLTDDYAAIPGELKEVDHWFNEEFLHDVSEADFYTNLAAVRKDLQNDRALLRTIHIFEENKRVEKGVADLKAGNIEGFLDMVNRSGKSSYQYLQNIYSDHDAKNQAVSLALALSDVTLRDRGAYRVHGGGFAGTIQAFVPNDLVEEYVKVMDTVFGEGSCHVLNVRKDGGIQVL